MQCEYILAKAIPLTSGRGSGQPLWSVIVLARTSGELANMY
uniref:Uncharacterized protein n=1 Tax=Anguilla anguilla TaxID=7936 RepID=A0A0E9PQJ2_ANGAN